MGRILTGFRVQLDGEVGIITALHGVVGCPTLNAFNINDSYRGLRISKVDLAFDAAFLVSPELRRSGMGLQTTPDFQGHDLRVVGYPQGLAYQFSHRIEPQIPALRPLLTTVPPRERDQLAQLGSPDVNQVVLSLSGAIQGGYSGAPILTWDGRVVGVANGGLRDGTVDIGWAMPVWMMHWEDARAREVDLLRLANGQASVLFGVEASPRSTLPRYYLADGGNPVGRIYDVRNGQLTPVYQRGSGRIYSVGVDPRGILYFSDHNDNHIYRLDQGREIRVFTHSTYIRDIAFDPQGRLFFSEATAAGGDGMIYQLQGGRPEPYFRVRLSEVDGFWAGNFAFDPDGTLWLSSGNRVPASLYKVVDGRLRRMLTSGGSISGIAFTEQGDLLYADWRQRVQRVELRGFLTSEALYSPEIRWASGITVARRP
jgi:hypothetical protein